MTQEEMNILVPQKLKEIEEQQGVTVLLAVESGSRAWALLLPTATSTFALYISVRLTDICSSTARAM